MATLTLPSELLQRHIEDFFAIELELRNGKQVSSPQMNGNSCRAAARLKWLDIAEKAVGDLRPGEVLRLAREINAAIAAAYDMPGE